MNKMMTKTGKRTRFITAVHLLVNEQQPRKTVLWFSVYLHHCDQTVDLYHATRTSYRRLLRALAEWGCDEGET